MLVAGNGLDPEPARQGPRRRADSAGGATSASGFRRRRTAPDDVVPGPAADVDRRVLDALRDPSAARPLRGLSVVVTRAAAQAAELSRPLRRRGARVIEVPTIRIDPPADGGVALEAALERVDRYQWMVLTSVNGARAVLDRLPDGRRLAGVRLAAIGPATAAALAAAHLPADLVPPRFVAESLLDVFPRGPGPGADRPGGGGPRRPARRSGGQGMGGRRGRGLPHRRARPSRPACSTSSVGADVACFTAPSTFERFCALAGLDRLPPHLACIGPITAAAVRRAGPGAGRGGGGPHDGRPGRSAQRLGRGEVGDGNVSGRPPTVS